MYHTINSAPNNYQPPGPIDDNRKEKLPADPKPGQKCDHGQLLNAAAVHRVHSQPNPQVAQNPYLNPQTLPQNHQNEHFQKLEKPDTIDSAHVGLPTEPLKRIGARPQPAQTADLQYLNVPKVGDFFSPCVLKSGELELQDTTSENFFESQLVDSPNPQTEVEGRDESFVVDRQIFGRQQLVPMVESDSDAQTKKMAASGETADSENKGTVQARSCDASLGDGSPTNPELSVITDRCSFSNEGVSASADQNRRLRELRNYYTLAESSLVVFLA